MKSFAILTLLLLSGVAGAQTDSTGAGIPIPESWNQAQAEAFARRQDLPLHVAIRLMDEACVRGEQTFALAFLDAYLTARESSLDTSRVIEMYGGLARCVGVPGDKGEVIDVLERAYDEFSPLASAHNDFGHVYRIGRALAEYRVQRGEAGPCSPHVHEARYRQQTGLDAMYVDFLSQREAAGEWRMHFFLLREIVLDESETALSLSRRLFLEGYYDQRYPEWRQDPRLLDILVRMTCTGNPGYLDTLIAFFFSNGPLPAEEQIHLLMDFLFPSKTGYDRHVELARDEDGRHIDANLRFSRGFGDAHGTSITFMAVEFQGQIYWLPVADGGHWVA